MFITKSNIPDNLKAAIHQEIVAVPQDMVRRSVQTFQIRVTRIRTKKWKAFWQRYFLDLMKGYLHVNKWHFFLHIYQIKSIIVIQSSPRHPFEKPSDFPA